MNQDNQDKSRWSPGTTGQPTTLSARTTRETRNSTPWGCGGRGRGHSVVVLWGLFGIYVCVNMYSTYVNTCVSISISISIYPSFSIYIYIILYLYMFTYLSVNLPIHPSMHPFIYLYEDIWGYMRIYEDIWGTDCMHIWHMWYLIHVMMFLLNHLS